jgi:hypothetical protein
LFCDAMHGSTLTVASNAEPNLRMKSGVDTIENWELPMKVVTARRKTSSPLLLLPCNKQIDFIPSE